MQQFTLERLVRSGRQQDSSVSVILPSAQGIQVAGMDKKNCKLIRAIVPSEERNLVARLDYASTNNWTDIKQVGILFLLLFAITHRVEEIAKAVRQVNAPIIKLMERKKVSTASAHTNTTTVTLMEAGYVKM